MLIKKGIDEGAKFAGLQQSLRCKNGEATALWNWKKVLMFLYSVSLDPMGILYSIGCVCLCVLDTCHNDEVGKSIACLLSTRSPVRINGQET